MPSGGCRMTSVQHLSRACYFFFQPTTLAEVLHLHFENGHPPEYSRPPDTTRCSPPIVRSGMPRRTPSNLNISAIPRDRRDFRIRRILPISAPTPVIKNRGIPTIPMGDHLVRNRIALDSRTSRGSSDTGPGIRRILPQVQSTDLPCVGVVGHGELALMSSLAAGNATEPTA